MTDVGEQARWLVEGMRKAVEAFEADHLSINSLVWALTSRIGALGHIADAEWVEELRSMRNQLEVVNAFFIESGRTSLNDKERREVGDTLGELRAALVAY
ncbi:MAG TPA: hypothetical protein DIT48_09095 [Actinobacteria bacterium]|nr:hypothetical protein [Actinomycetota bacterium]HCP62686.1 hypothetical protein [Actinomycetota bacterium]